MKFIEEFNLSEIMEKKLPVLKHYKNLGIFRLSPENYYKDYSISHLQKGSDYHERFNTFVGRKILFSGGVSCSCWVVTALENSRHLGQVVSCG